MGDIRSDNFSDSLAVSRGSINDYVRVVVDQARLFGMADGMTVYGLNQRWNQ